jgi:hypothetical protein
MAQGAGDPPPGPFPLPARSRPGRRGDADRRQPGRYCYHLDAVHPGVEHMVMSARTGAGLDAFRDWLAALPARRRVAA